MAPPEGRVYQDAEAEQARAALVKASTRIGKAGRRFAARREEQLASV